MNLAQYFRTYLYVPASKPEVVTKAFNSNADCVVLDLEDAVHHDQKDQAREFVSNLLESTAPKPFLVRINNPASEWGDADLAALAKSNLLGVRIPKVTSVETVQYVASKLKPANPAVQLHLLIESASGVAKAVELATADPNVASMSLGEADLESDIRSGDDSVLQYCRNAIVVASRAAGLKQPSQSVFPNTKDSDGLRESTLRAKSAGFFGRSVIHPSQIDIVNEIFTPTEEEVASAKELLGWYDQMQASGNSVMALPNGDLLDPANIHYAKFIVALNESQNN